MNLDLTKPRARGLARVIPFVQFAVLPVLLFLLGVPPSHAGSATWNLNPTSGDWNTAANWTPETIPNGVSDIATFDVSSVANVTVSAQTAVNGIVFDPAASAFTTTVDSGEVLSITGIGVSNSSQVTQNFATALGNVPGGAMIQFSGPATAGDGVVYTNNGSVAQGFTGGSVIKFSGFATAGTAVLDNKGGPATGKGGGIILFEDESTAANASFVNEQGAASGAAGGQIQFYSSSSAGAATFTLQGSSLPLVSGGYAAGTIFFNDSSSANDASFFLEGGQVNRAPGAEIQFYGSSHAGNAFFTVGPGAVAGSSAASLTFAYDATPENATIMLLAGANGAAGGNLYLESSAPTATTRVEVFGNATVNCTTATTVGSIEGDGYVFASKLIVGTNNLDAVLSGVILADSLIKTGAGTMSLYNAENDVTKLVVAAGTLLINSEFGSGSSGQTIEVSGGRLVGRGLILCQTQIGTGHGRGANLSPGNPGGLGTLTFEEPLKWASDGVYSFDLNSVSAKSDRILANGVVINAGATFLARDRGALPLPPGTSLLAINNTSETAITGTFANLPDGSLLTVGSNTYLISYEGGDGNDLTLTVQ